MKIDREKHEKLNAYLDEIMPVDPRAPHPFNRFHLHEIVRHPTFGWGIVTGFRMPDLDRELEGLGIQFVDAGEMKEHRVFTASECRDIEITGLIYQVSQHAGMTLEAVVDAERGDGLLPGLRHPAPDDTTR